jgi:hypothetical protein
MSSPPKCAHCGDVIDVHESMIVVQSGEAHETSRFAEPDLIRVAKWHYHRRCHEALQAAHGPIGE